MSDLRHLEDLYQQITDWDLKDPTVIEDLRKDIEDFSPDISFEDIKPDEES